MAKKIDIELVEMVLKHTTLTALQQSQILEDLKFVSKQVVGDDPHSALEKLHCAAHDFNQTPKGRRMPIKTITEACEFGSAKLFKERKIWVRTKEPVLVLPTNGRIVDVEEL